MLTGNLVRVRYARDRLVPYYVDATDPELLETADRLLACFRTCVGRPRGLLTEELRELTGADPAQWLAQGLCKLLEDRCEFAVVSGVPPELVRETTFRLAAQARQLQPPGPEARFDRTAILQSAGESLQLTPADVEQALFADLKSEQCVQSFDDITAERLLQRYNVALAQALLLRSVKVRVSVRSASAARYRQLFRALKFRRLICDIERETEQSYCLKLDGPLSLFSATLKYGLQLALFLPELLQCEEFELQAEVHWGVQKKEKRFLLSSKDGLVSPRSSIGSYVPVELRMFVELFRKKAVGWEIAEESEVYPLGSSYWVPDFRLVHQATGRAVLLEVLGYWRKHSAERHLANLKQYVTEPFLLAVSQKLHLDEEALSDLPAELHHFRDMPLPDEVVQLAERLLGVAAEAKPKKKPRTPKT